MKIPFINKAPTPNDDEKEITRLPVSQTPTVTSSAPSLKGISQEDISFKQSATIVDSSPIGKAYQKQIDTIGDYWPAQSLFHGTVIDVEWNTKGGSFATESSSPTDEDIDVAIGSNQEEALAALISSEHASRIGGSYSIEERHSLEEFLAGFTLNMLSELEDADGYYKFKQSIHREAFFSMSSGTIYDYVAEEISHSPLVSNRIGSTSKRKVVEQATKEQAVKGKARFNSIDTNFRSSEDDDRRPAKIIGYPAPRYYEAKDPVVIISNTQRSTRFGGDGKYREDGLLECRNVEPSFFGGGFDARWGLLYPESYSSDLNAHGGIPSVCKKVIWESEVIANEYSDNEGFRKNINAIIFSSSTFSSNFGFPSPIALNPWRQAWIPILLDYEFEYTPQNDNWKLGLADFEQINPSQVSTSAPIIISGRMPLASKTGRIIADQIQRFLDEEHELDETDDGVISDDVYLEISALIKAYRTRDMLSATLTGLDEELEKIHIDDPLRSGMMKITKMSVLDSYGQVKELDVTSPQMQSPTVGLSLETVADNSTILMKPRIPQGARLNLRLLANDDDGSEANSGSSKINLDDEDIPSAKSPICAFLLPDHIEWAMEVFDSQGTACGQLRVGERNWALNGIQKGKLVWDTAPGSDTPIGTLPNTGNLHADNFLNKLYEIGLIDEVERGSSYEYEDNLSSAGGEGVLSALLRAIDTTYWDMDPFGKGGSDHPAFYMGRPIAVVRAKLRLEIDESERTMSDALRKYSFDVKLGLLEKVGDGLLGYFVNDDYTKLHTIYPVVDDGTGGLVPGVTGSVLAQKCDLPEDNEHNSATCEKCIAYEEAVLDHQALDHPFLEFDPIVEIRPEEDVYLTLLINIQSSVHVTCGFLPQKEITLLREHWEDAVARIAPTFKVGPVLVDPSSIRMPIDNAKPNLIWKWANKPSTTEWTEMPIANSDDLAGLPTGKTKAYEGWIKLDIDESQDN
ncbi:MAG: hypothetical protein HOE92_02655 [Euryarchaeota archaeon]|nr:hypothetical protein [Euryarchaeota archaeon]MBT3971101.1 hypothetical protein [Euryarchaeota archaeon]